MAEIMREIAERKRPEEELRAQRDFAELVMESMGQGLAVSSIIEDGWRLEYVNPALARMVGRTPEELIGRSLEDFVAAEDVPRIRQGHASRLAGETTSYELRLRRSDGEIVYAQVTGVPRKLGDRIVGSITVITDMTQRYKAEQGIRSSEQRLEEVIAFLPDPILAIEKGGKVIAWNRAMEELTSVKAEDMLGKGDYEYAVPFYGTRRPMLVDLVLRPDEQIEKLYSRLQREGETVVAEVYIPTFKPGGAYFWSKATPLYDSRGNVAGAIESIRDITDRKLVEGKLQENEEKYRLLVETANEAIVVAQDGMLKYVNLKAVEITGYFEEEMTSRPFVEFIHPEDREMVVDKYLRRLRGEGPVPVYAFRIVEKGGRTRWVEINAVLIEWEGRPATLNFLSDITERKRMNDELRETRDYLENLISHANAPIIVWDPDLRVTKFNHAFERLTGRSAEGVLGQPLEILFPSEGKEEALAHVQRTLAGERWDALEIPILKADGRERTVLWNSATLYERDGKTVMAAIAQGQDITERKQLEDELRRARDELEARVRERTNELQTKTAEMERFIYTVSHDLRSPLITVNGFAGLLKKDLERGDAEKVKADLVMIEDAIKRMDHLLSDTLELSRIGRVVNPPEVVPFAAIAQEALDQAAEMMRQRGVQACIASGMPSVHVDRLRIVEALVNLIENSVKYMGQEKDPRIEIGHRTDGGSAVFFVRDNGIGIDPSQHEKVFSLFYKVDPKSEGTGAGLAIVKRIIEVHGGRIWIESELGEGCSVCITLLSA
jgi:PAS domain S-box-containing protein